MCATGIRKWNSNLADVFVNRDKRFYIIKGIFRNLDIKIEGGLFVLFFCRAGKVGPAENRYGKGSKEAVSARRLSA